MKRYNFKKHISIISAVVLFVTAVFIKMPVAEATGGEIIEIMPLINFNEWTYKELAAGATYTGNYIDGVAPSGEKFYAVNNPGIIDVGVRDKGDRFVISKVGELNYTTANNREYMGRAVALTEGEQMVYSFEAYGSSNNLVVDIRLNNDGGPTYMCSVGDGVLNIYNGVAHEISNGINGKVVAKYTLPENQWTRIDLVYTRFGTTKTGVECDSAEVYLNGQRTRATSTTSGTKDGYVIPMDGCILDYTLQRFTLHNGIYDNMRVKHYKNGAKFTPVSGVVHEIIPYVDFEEWTDAEVLANMLYIGNYTDEEAPDGEQFYVANNPGTITVLEKDDGDKYLKNGVGELYYRDTDNLYTLGKWTSGLKDGEQMVFSFDAHSTLSNGGKIYIRNDNDSGPTTMLGISNGYLNLYNGMAGNASAIAAKCKLPTGVWSQIDLVYTRNGIKVGGQGYDSLTVYIDKKPQFPIKYDGGGYLDSHIMPLESYILDSSVSRFTIGGGAYDNLSAKLYTSGAKYKPDTEELGDITTIVPMLDFDGCTEEPVVGSTYVTSYDENGDAIENTTLKIAPDDKGTFIADSDGRGMKGDGKYIKTGGNVQYSAANNPGFKKPEIFEGDKLMLSFRLDTQGPSSGGYIRYEGDRYFEENNSISSIINFNRMYTFGTTTDHFSIFNGEISGDDGDGISEEAIATVKLPSDRWVTITMLYTAGDAKLVTAGSSNAAEVVSCTRPDTVVLFVNNIQVTGQLELSESNMFRALSRYEFQGGYYDDICSRIYSGGAKFKLSHIPGFDAADAEKYEMYGSMFYTDKTVGELKETIEVQSFTDSCAIVDADGNEVADDLAAATADCVIVKSKNGMTYAFGIENRVDEEAIFAYDGEENLTVSGTAISGTSDGYGKSPDDKAYALGAETDNTKRIELYDFSEFGLLTTDASPLYITFDMICKNPDSAGVMSLSGEVNLAGNGGTVTENGVKVVDISANGKGDVYTSVQNGTDKSATVGRGEKLRTGEWHRVAVQLYPGRHEYSVYVDGVYSFDGEFCGAFAGVKKMYLDCNIEGVCIDNIESYRGIYDMTLAKVPGILFSDGAQIPEGYELGTDTLTINKAELKTDWLNAVPFEVEETSLDIQIKFLDTHGTEIDAPNGDVVPDKIVLCTDDGRFRYWNIEQRKGTGMYQIGGNKVMLDVDEEAELGDLSQLTMYVASYDNNGRLTGIQKEKANYVDGQTCFFNNLIIDDLDKVFVWSESGIKPVIKAQLPTIACWGDGLTLGIGGELTSYPKELEKLGGYNVYNMGAGAESATTIAVRSGGLEARLDYDAVIPGDKTPVEVVVSAYNNTTGKYAGIVLPEDVSVGGWNLCTICGIKGELSVNSEGVLIFTRSEEGVVVEACAGERVFVDANNTDADVNIFFAGTFGVGSTMDEVTSDSNYLYLAKIINSMVKSSGSDKYIVIGLTSGDRDTWRQTNSLLSGNFGKHFVDAKSYLASVRALEESGVVPTTDDYRYIGRGHIPPAFLAEDGNKVYLNDVGYKMLAKLVYEKLLELGYCR